MSVLWQIGGIAAATLGATNLQRSRVSLGQDTFSFSIPGRPADSAFRWAYGEALAVTRNGAGFFRGRVVGRGRGGSGTTEGHQYQLAGPWWDLERLVYQQPWKSGTWVAGVWTLGEPKWQSRVILGQDADGNAQTTGQVVAEVIAYARSCGVALEVGAIDAGVRFPWDEVTDVACSEVILRCLRWTPGVTSWIDYGPETPKFYLVARSAGTSVSVPATICASFQARPRDDQAIPAVVLHYERVDTTDGHPSRMRTTDAYPLGATGKEVGALVCTIELAGSSVTSQVQRCVVDEFPADPFAHNTAWWLARCEALRNPAITDLVITGEGRSGTLPNELITGALQDWMRASIEDPADCDHRITSHYHLYNLHDEEDVWTCKATYKLPDPTRGNELVTKTDSITVRLTATDALSRDYVKRDVRYGDDPIAGLAEALYQTMQGVRTAGSVVVQEEECTGVASPSSVLSLSALVDVFVAGIVQRVTEDLGRGQTTIEAGPPNHLGPQDLIELLRINRTRRPSGRNVERATGLVSSAGTVELGSAIPKRVVMQGQIPGEWMTVITGVRYDTATDQLQVKTRDVRVVTAATESGWTLAEGGQAVDCPE